MACVFLLACLSGAAQAAASSSVLPPGGELRAGDSLTSPNAQYILAMQPDGNLVEYNQYGRYFWNTATGGNPGAHVDMQYDGNLVVYSQTGNVLWSSNTGGDPGDHLQLQSDANVVIRSLADVAFCSCMTNDRLMPGEHLAPTQFLVSSNYSLQMQTDGNLVEYNPSGQALWSSVTGGHPGASAVMQPDGNLVVYSQSGQALWNSGTGGHPGAYFDLESEGSALILLNGQLFWGANRTPGQTLSSNPGGSGQCTYWAEAQFHAATGTYANTFGPNNGNAMYWAQNAQAHGWTVTTTPQLDSIVVFQPGVDGAGPGTGHVAWVTAVNGSQITVTEMNVHGLGVVDTANYTVRPGMSFILATR